MITVKLVYKFGYVQIVEIEKERVEKVKDLVWKKESFYLTFGVTTILVNPDHLMTMEIV